MSSTVEVGSAKPTPSTNRPSRVSRATNVVSPITSPSSETSAPPELPWFSAASVWISPSSLIRGRANSAAGSLTMPDVTAIRSLSSEFPIASTVSPCAGSWRLNGAGISASGDVRSTATSVYGASSPTSSASRSSPSGVRMRYLVMPSITCAAVTTWPDESSTIPVASTAGVRTLPSSSVTSSPSASITTIEGAACA